MNERVNESMYVGLLVFTTIVYHQQTNSKQTKHVDHLLIKSMSNVEPRHRPRRRPNIEPL